MGVSSGKPFSDAAGEPFVSCPDSGHYFPGPIIGLEIEQGSAGATDSDREVPLPGRE